MGFKPTEIDDEMRYEQDEVTLTNLISEMLSFENQELFCRADNISRMCLKQKPSAQKLFRAFIISHAMLSS